MIVFDDAAPMSVEDRRALFAWADSILPMILIGETTTRPAEHGDFDFLEGSDDIIANPAGVGNRAVLADPNAFVNASAEVLGELAVDIAVDSSAGLVGVNDQFCRS